MTNIDVEKLIGEIEGKIVDLGVLEFFNAEAHLYNIKNAAFREAIDLIRKHANHLSHAGKMVEQPVSDIKAHEFDTSEYVLLNDGIKRNSETGYYQKTKPVSGGVDEAPSRLDICDHKFGNIAPYPRKCFGCGKNESEIHAEEFPKIWTDAYIKFKQLTPADETLRDAFSKTIQELINFVSKAADYQGELTNDTACQLLRDIELDALRVAQPPKPSMTMSELKHLIYSQDKIKLNYVNNIITALQSAGVLNVRNEP